MTQPPPPFDIDQSDDEAYRAFIESLRQTVQDPDHQSHGRPVLPPQQNPPTSWFDVTLRTGGVGVILRLRRDNLYLDGFHSEDPRRPQWYELAESNRRVHLIPGSTFTGFDGSYRGLEGAARRRRDAIGLGQVQLQQAVRYLATSDDGQQRAWALLVVVQMISEAVRFTTISDAVYTTSEPPTAQMLTLENSWGDLSGALLRMDLDQTAPFPEVFRQPNDLGITTAEGAAAVLGIVLCYSLPRALLDRMIAENVVETGQYYYPQGRALAEIFSVSIDNIDGENPGELFGTIKASDGLSTQDIYNRPESNPESVVPGQWARLTGPPRVISASGSFTIDLDLSDYDVISHNDPIATGPVPWNVYEPFNVYDHKQAVQVTGANGAATVTYMVMSDAVEARLEIVPINAGNPANIYGTITAYTVHGEYVLFDVEKNNAVEVYPSNSIPLRRPALAMPMNDWTSPGSRLKVHATLWASGWISDSHIARGTVYFDPLFLQSASRNIGGPDGDVDVRVTWS